MTTVMFVIILVSVVFAAGCGILLAKYQGALGREKVLKQTVQGLEHEIKFPDRDIYRKRSDAQTRLAELMVTVERMQEQRKALTGEINILAQLRDRLAAEIVANEKSKQANSAVEQTEANANG